MAPIFVLDARRHPVDPLPRQISLYGEILSGSKISVSRRLRWPVVVATELAEDRLAKRFRRRLSAVVAGARATQFIAHHVRQPERVTALVIGFRSKPRITLKFMAK